MLALDDMKLVLMCCEYDKTFAFLSLMNGQSFILPQIGHFSLLYIILWERKKQNKYLYTTSTTVNPPMYRCVCRQIKACVYIYCTYTSTYSISMYKLHFIFVNSPCNLIILFFSNVYFNHLSLISSDFTFPPLLLSFWWRHKSAAAPPQTLLQPQRHKGRTRQGFCAQLQDRSFMDKNLFSIYTLQ